eukprot:scaffold11551_cov112-Isochrysis_galbana.AAC.1
MGAPLPSPFDWPWRRCSGGVAFGMSRKVAPAPTIADTWYNHLYASRAAQLSPLPFARNRQGFPAALLSPCSQATKNDAGLWVVGKSKSNNRKAHTPARPATTQTLRRFYAPWQHDLRTLLASHNLSLLPDLPIPQ